MLYLLAISLMVALSSKTTKTTFVLIAFLAKFKPPIKEFDLKKDSIESFFNFNRFKNKSIQKSVRKYGGIIYCLGKSISSYYSIFAWFVF